MTTATISALFRYPVKSMGGEALQELEIGPRGAVGDRVWAVRRGDAFRSEAAAIVKKHASRKDPGVPMRFRRDPEPAADGAGEAATATPRAEQLKLDL